MHQLTVAEIVIIVAVTIGAITDMRTTKIYNWLTFPTAIAGLVINSMQNFSGAGFSLNGAGLAVCGWLLAVFIMCLPKPSQKIAFGDVKLMGAVGACLGAAKWCICWFYFSLTYGLIALVLIARAIPKDQIKGFWLMFKTFFTAGIDLSDTVDTSQMDEARKKKIPIGPAIAIGTYLGIFFDKPLLQFLGLHLN
jgi:prepilin peptidase CpaA